MSAWGGLAARLLVSVTFKQTKKRAAERPSSTNETVVLRVEQKKKKGHGGVVQEQSYKVVPAVNLGLVLPVERPVTKNRKRIGPRLTVGRPVTIVTTSKA